MNSFSLHEAALLITHYLKYSMIIINQPHFKNRLVYDYMYSTVHINYNHSIEEILSRGGIIRQYFVYSLYI